MKPVLNKKLEKIVCSGRKIISIQNKIVIYSNVHWNPHELPVNSITYDYQEWSTGYILIVDVNLSVTVAFNESYL